MLQVTPHVSFGITRRCCWPTRAKSAAPREVWGLRSTPVVCTVKRSTTFRVTCQRGDYSGNQKNDKRTTSFKFNGTEVRFQNDNLWQLALPVGAFMAVSALLGPLVIGLAASALAVGAVFSAGAFAFSTMFLPLFMLAGFGMLAFGFLPLTGLMAVGVLSIFTKLLSVGIAIAGLAIGWGVVNWMLPKKGAAKVAEFKDIDINDTRFELTTEEREMIEESRRRSAEFISFDDELRRREQRKRSSAPWK